MMEAPTPVGGVWAPPALRLRDAVASQPLLVRNWPLIAGIAILAMLTFVDLAMGPWAGEQGSYGLILLALSVWMIARRWPKIQAAGRPGDALIGGALLASALGLHLFGRVLGWVPVEALALYLALVVTLYLFAGWKGLRVAGFPLLYAAIAIPPPPGLVALFTAGLRLRITEAAVTTLDAFGLVVARSGLTLYIDQYRIAVAEACSGINSLVSLAAIGFFYIHIRGRRLDPLSIGIAAALTFAFAVLANFVRVVGIVLMTHFWGVGVAQGPLHQLLGFFCFAIALGGVMALDALIPQMPRRHAERGAGE